jgi:hypothetical protein
MRAMSKCFYVTTAIDYVNGQPHSWVLAASGEPSALLCRSPDRQLWT